MIKHILDNLNIEQQKQLMYAFEHEFSQFVRFNKNRFIGVNVDSIKKLDVKERAGVWAIGIIKGS